MNSVGASSSNLLGLVFRGWRLATILPALLLVCCRCAFPLDPSLDISQYAHTAWRVRDGFPKGAIATIAQTPDGYLWLGTELGLFRFDGVRAVPWQPPPGEQLPSRVIMSLLVAQDGALWIGTMKGLASWKDGRLTQYPQVAGQIVGPLLQDHEGTVWFGAFAPGRVCAIRGSKVQCYGAGTFGPGAFGLYEDAEGNLWVSTSTGLWRWNAGRPERIPLPGGLLADALIEDSNGSLLIATVKGLEQLAAAKFRVMHFQV
jgi:ligand-binding sensor domain-containing protein